jgi:hypothetical protein
MPIHEVSLIRPENLKSHEQLVVDGVDVSGHWSTFIQSRAVTDYNEALQEEIAQFLSTNGVFRDVPQMVDMVCAQVYAEYICEQGGSYLRADFSAPEDPMQHTRRLLGLDGVRAADGRARFAAIDGEAREAFTSGDRRSLE